jgi:hypothetical protein
VQVWLAAGDCTCVGEHPRLCIAWHVHLNGGTAAVEAMPLKVVDALHADAASTAALQDASTTPHTAQTPLQG